MAWRVGRSRKEWQREPCDAVAGDLVVRTRRPRGAGSPRAAGAAENPYDQGTGWLTFRAGIAKSKVDGASPQGGPSFGFAYSYMLKRTKLGPMTLFRKFSVGGSVHYDHLGSFASAQEIEVPAMLELTRHFEWGKGTLYPYLGFGGGMVYRKFYRTGDDRRFVEPGYYLTLGTNIPVGHRQLIGIDLRWLRLDATNDPPNPVFGVGSGSIVQQDDGSTKVEHGKGTHMGVKIGYTIAY
jgi:hypothetical protein